MQHNRDSACSHVLIQAFVHLNIQKKAFYQETQSLGGMNECQHSASKMPTNYSARSVCHVDPLPLKCPPLITKGNPKIKSCPPFENFTCSP